LCVLLFYWKDTFSFSWNKRRRFKTKGGGIMAKPNRLNPQVVLKRDILTHASTTYLAAMISFFLLFTGRSGYSGITESKYTVFLVITLSYVSFCFAILLSRFVKANHRKEFIKMHLLPNSSTQIFFLLYLCFTIASSLLSDYAAHTWVGMTRYEGSISIALYVTVFSLFSKYYRPAKWHLYLLGATTFIFSIISFFQQTGMNPFELYPKGLTYFDAEVAYRGAYLGTIGNVDLVAAFQTLAIPLLFCFPFYLKDERTRVLWLSADALLAVLTKAQVMAGVLGVSLGLILSLPMLLPLSKKKRFYLACVLIVGLLLILLGVRLWSTPPSGTLFELHEILNGRWDDSFGTWRVYIWRNVVKIIPEHLWFGGGPDTLAVRMNVFFDTYDENQIHTVRAVIDTAHNEYLNILVNQGLLALLCYMGGLISLAVCWIRKCEIPIVAVTGCATLCYVIQALFGFSMFITAPFFWICLAILESSLRENC